MADARNEEYTIIPLNDQIISLAVNLTIRHALRGYEAVFNTALLDAKMSPLRFVSADDDLCKATHMKGFLPTIRMNIDRSLESSA